MTRSAANSPVVRRGVRRIARNARRSRNIPRGQGRTTARGAGGYRRRTNSGGY